MDHANELLTAAEVAAKARVTTTTVSRWVADGSLAAIRLPGGSLRFRPDDVAALLTPKAAS